MIYIPIIIVTLLMLYVLSTYCRRPRESTAKLRGWSYAHRGLHGAEAPENSLEAFRRAKDSGFGSELDIHLLADGNLAVIHDYKLERTTGMPGVIEELTTGDLLNYKLEGTTETIPLFSDVLKLYSGVAPLIVELKASAKNVPQLCETACKMLDTYDGIYCVESFDPRCIYWLRKHRPDIVRGQLTENYFASSTSKLPWILKWVLRHQILNFLTRPDFIAYRYSDRKTISNIICRKLWRAQGVSWTLVSKEEYDLAVSEDWIPIFENFIP
jgi:glycerophosphoryl diester phosphodiesterase